MMQFLKKLFLISALFSLACEAPAPKIQEETTKKTTDKLDPRILDCRQVLLSVTESLNDQSGKLYLFESKPEGWSLREGPFRVNYGKNGLAWGIGIHEEQSGIQKQEGDLKSPAGIFELGTAFGYGKKPKGCKTNYLQIDDNTQCIEDVKSRSYNKIIDNEVVLSDWSSTDLMKRNDDLFKYGFFVNHNTMQIPGKGSCIFFHLWRSPDSNTAGCTALSEQNMLKVINWMDFWKRPLLVQMPRKNYLEYCKKYNLPSIK